MALRAGYYGLKKMLFEKVKTIAGLWDSTFTKVSDTTIITSENMTISKCVKVTSGLLVAYQMQVQATGDIAANSDILTGFDNLALDFGGMAGVTFRTSSGVTYDCYIRVASSVVSLRTTSGIPSGTNLRGTLVYIKAGDVSANRLKSIDLNGILEPEENKTSPEVIEEKTSTKKTTTKKTVKEGE